MKAVCAGVVFLVGLGLFGPASAGANSKIIERIGAKNQQAMENYDLLEYEDAKKILNEAVGLAKKHGIEDPVVARTYLNLAIVYFSGFQDAESAKLALIDAVQIDPNIEIDPAYRTSELASLVAKTKEEYGTAGGTGGTSSAGPADCGAVQGIEHTLVSQAQAGEPREISALVSAELEAQRVILYYRGAGTSDFAEVKMEKAGGCEYAGSIPGSAVTGEALHYYVAAVNAGGKTVASRGSSASPNIIEVVQTGGSALGGGDSENPLGGGGPDQSIEKGGELEGDTGGASVYALVPIGTGGAYVTGSTEQRQNDVGCCFAPALLSLSPEIGYFFNPRLSVAAAFRMGFPVGANLPGHATGAPAGLVRVRYGLGEDLNGVHLVGTAGGGILRHTVKLSNAPAGMDTDTVASGPFMLGAGVAYWKQLGGPMRFVAELHTLAGMPLGVEELGSCSGDAAGASCVRPNYSLHFDVNLGVLFSF